MRLRAKLSHAPRPHPALSPRVAPPGRGEGIGGVRAALARPALATCTNGERTPAGSGVPALPGAEAREKGVRMPRLRAGCPGLIPAPKPQPGTLAQSQRCWTGNQRRDWEGQRGALWWRGRCRGSAGGDMQGHRPVPNQASPAPGPARAARTAEGTGTRAGTNWAPRDREGAAAGTQREGHSACACPPAFPTAPARFLPPRGEIFPLALSPPGLQGPPGQHSPALGAGRGSLIAYVPSGCSSQGCLHIKTLLHKYIYIYLLYIYRPGSMHGQAEGSAVLLERCSLLRGGQSPAPRTGDPE